MTAIAMPNALEKLTTLDEQTLSTVLAAFGRDPRQGELTADDLARLDAMIDAVTAGLNAARDASEAAGIPMTPETPAEVEAPELADEVPVTTANLRQRIRDMDEAARNVFLGNWARSGLTQTLAGTDGTDVLLDRDTHAALEDLIAQHEPPADPSVYEPLFARLAASPPGVRFAVMSRVGAHGIANMANRLGITVGRAWALAKTIEDVEVEAATIPPTNLPPLGQPGQVVTEPVDTAADLAEVPPAKGTIDDLLAWVNGDPTRARALLDRELTKEKPRKGLVAKIEPIAAPAATSSGEGEVAAPQPAPSPVPFADPGETTGGDADALATPLTQFAAPADGVVADPGGAAPPEDEATTPPPSVGVVPVPGQGTIDEHLQSSRFREVPVSEWGPLQHAGYLRRLAAELGQAADILERYGADATATFNGQHQAGA